MSQKCCFTYVILVMMYNFDGKNGERELILFCRVYRLAVLLFSATRSDEDD